VHSEIEPSSLAARRTLNFDLPAPRSFALETSRPSPEASLGSSGSTGSVSLGALRPGERGTIRGVQGMGPVFQRLAEMGFVRGASVRMLRYAPFGDPIAVEIRGYCLSLRRSEAALVEVDRLP
jgi:ferrous iron transport protein A